MSENTTLGGVWLSDYVKKLGIVDHCREIIVIDEEIKRMKNVMEMGEVPAFGVKILEDHFKKECADLQLLISNFISSELLLERLDKFWSKEKEERDGKVL